MSLRQLLPPLVGVAVAAALLGAGAIAQYRPLVGIPLIVVAAIGAIWLLATYGTDL
jgi:hypothetical protein